MSELMDQLRAALRSRHYSRRTEQAYCLWVRRFIRFHGAAPPGRAGRARDQRLPHPSGRRRARQRLDPDPGALGAPVPLPPRARPRGRRARRPGPRAQAHASAGRAHARGGAGACSPQLDGDQRLMASLMYGSGLRLMECLRLRVQDIDLGARRDHRARRQGRQGPRHHAAALAEARPAASSSRGPRRARARPRRRLGPRRAARRRWRASTRAPPAEWRWQWVFPQQRRWTNPQTGEQGRHHVHETIVQRAVKDAVRRAGIDQARRPATPCGTRSPPTCSRPATTSAPSRSCSATRT